MACLRLRCSASSSGWFLARDPGRILGARVSLDSSGVSLSNGAQKQAYPRSCYAVPLPPHGTACTEGVVGRFSTFLSGAVYAPSVERSALCAVIGLETELSAVMRAMISREECWDAVTTFAEAALLRAGGPHKGGRCLAEFNSAGRSSATRRGREAPGDLRRRVGAQQWAMWSVSLVGWRAFKARAVPHTERGNGGQCDPPGQGRSSVPRRTGDKSVTRRCEPVESGPPAVSGPSEESVVTESGERSREKERHSPFDKLGRVLRRDGSASSIGFRSRSSSQASTASKAHSQQVSPARLTSGEKKMWGTRALPPLMSAPCSEGGSIRYPTSGVTRLETPRAAKRSRQEGSNSGSPTSGPPLARRGRIRTPFTGLRSEPVVVVEKMDLAEFLMRSGDSASGSADPPEAPMGGESRATKTSSRKAHKSGSSHSSRGTDSTSVNVAKDRPYKELGTASESDECEEATTVHHRGDQYVSIRAGLAAGAPSDALKDVLDWEREIVSECDSIINTARKSANLKGTSVKSLKGSATKIKGALANVCDALYPEEIRTLKANNTRLQEDVNRMRKEIEELKVELRVARLRPSHFPVTEPIGGGSTCQRG
ncbi:hypothetical protein ACJJTC_018657 [Scirpophaga incertulas]